MAEPSPLAGNGLSDHANRGLEALIRAMARDLARRAHAQKQKEDQEPARDAG
jgi:hypothetical protein